jgi:Fic family protein
MYIWQRPEWPAFIWDERPLAAGLARIRELQKELLGGGASLPEGGGKELELDALLDNAIRTSEIEGEHLNVDSVRSSVARRLGLEQAGLTGRPTQRSEALVGLLVEATRDYQRPLDFALLCRWQTALFPEGVSLVNPIRVGALRGDEPMQVVSGRIDRPQVHFEAPLREGLENELQAFCNWFNAPPTGLDPLLRAGVAHLWLVTLHPFDDGNGRVTRAVTDMALAQAEHLSIRFYSLSGAIMARRRDYYRALEAAQKGTLEVTAWLEWFLIVLEESLLQARLRLQRVLNKSRFWQRHAQTILNERQIKVLNRLLDGLGEEFEAGVNASKYRALAKVSKATATRDLADLLEKGCIERLPGGGRSTRYGLPEAFGMGVYGDD